MAGGREFTAAEGKGRGDILRRPARAKREARTNRGPVFRGDGGPAASAPFSGPRQIGGHRGSSTPSHSSESASQNVIATADGMPASRAHFYAPYWSLLRQAVSHADPTTTVDWERLASDLVADTSPHWPGG